MERSTDMGRQLRPAATAPFAAGLAVLAALLAGCGGQPPPSVPQNAPQVGPAVVTALPDVPSPQAEMVCQPEAQQDIQDIIGVVPTAVGPIQYANHTSTCRYAYPNGAFTLVVQDLPNDITTTRTYEALAGKLGRVEKIDLPDAEAYTHQRRLDRAAPRHQGDARRRDAAPGHVRQPAQPARRRRPPDHEGRAELLGRVAAQPAARLRMSGGNASPSTHRCDQASVCSTT